MVTCRNDIAVLSNDRETVNSNHTVQVAPLAAAFVGYVVFWNLSLQVNSVGFYQLSKIMVLPTVAALEVRAMACSEHLHCALECASLPRCPCMTIPAHEPHKAVIHAALRCGDQRFGCIPASMSTQDKRKALQLMSALHGTLCAACAW